MRYQEVVVKNDVEPYHFVATGFLAVAIQHELDHLNSKLFMDAEVPKKTSIVVKAKLGPNELCSCNSGRKFKKCCGK